MLQFKLDPVLAERKIPFGVVEVWYPEGDTLQTEAFYSLVEEELSQLRCRYEEYDRKAVFGENPYVRFFKKFKKTYPVMTQFESVLLKGRPFPRFNPVAEVPFLMEIVTHVLSGTHDADQISGTVELYSGTCKEEFPGLRGVPFHTYPGDFCGRDEEGIIFSMIAGADARTCAKSDSRHVLYPIFRTPELSADVILNTMDVLARYVRVLAPDAQIDSYVL